jgi:hypothetical protein
VRLLAGLPRLELGGGLGCCAIRRDHGGPCLPYLSLRFKIGEPSCFRWIDSPCSGLSRQLAAAPLYALQRHTIGLLLLL